MQLTKGVPRLPKELVDYILSLLSPIYYPISYYLIDQQRYKYYTQIVRIQLKTWSNEHKNVSLLNLKYPIDLNIVQHFSDRLYFTYNKRSNRKLEDYFNLKKLSKYQMHLIYQMYKDDLDFETILSCYNILLDELALWTIGLLAFGDDNPMYTYSYFNSALQQVNPCFVACIAAYMGQIHWFVFLEDSVKLQLNTRYHICAFAALGKRFDCLKYLYEDGYCWNGLTCIYAAQSGSLACLEYALSNGCPYDGSAFIEAAEKGHLDCLEYLTTQHTTSTQVCKAYLQAKRYKQYGSVQYIESIYQSVPIRNFNLMSHSESLSSDMNWDLIHF